ncbi:MAG: radical SAM protein [Candidatus Omnitrophota bacterium]
MAAITPFDPWKAKLCTCPQKYSVSAYVGCGHGCRYCYASSYIINFFSPRPKKNFLVQLRKEIKKLPANAILTIANSSDPYQPLEKKLKLTRELIKTVRNVPAQVQLVTKSSLITRDMDIFKDYKNIVVSFTITTLNQKLANKLEPFVPQIEEKLKAIELLSHITFVACRFDPLIYPLNTGEIKKMVRELKMRGVKQIITSTYKIKPDNFKRMVTIFPAHKDLWQKIYYREGERISGYIYLPIEMRKRLIREVKEAAQKEKIDFSSCREGFQEFNTAPCDGSMPCVAQKTY